jgi:hypothetical protein
VDPPGRDLHQEQRVDPGQTDRVLCSKSQASNPLAWLVRDCVQVAPPLRDAGSTPALVRTEQDQPGVGPLPDHPGEGVEQ